VKVWLANMVLGYAAAAAATEGAAPPAAATGNEIIHVMQAKPHPFGGRWEGSLLGAAQVNGKFTDHLGTGAQVTYHLAESFAVLVDGIYYPYAQATQFSDELLTSYSLTPQAANQLLLRWAAGIGVEMAPIYGKFAFYSDKLAQFAIYVRAGGGITDTRLELVPPTRNDDGTISPAVYGDTGLKLMGTFGIGARVYLTHRLAIRAEIRDQVLTARVSEINGCDADDLEALSAGGASASVKSGCDKGAFSDPARQAGPGKALIEKPSSDVVNNIAAVLGVSVLF
jgi:outer membrane beta-barrel protein